MSERTLPKEAALMLVGSLSDDVTYEEIMHQLYVPKKSLAGWRMSKMGTSSLTKKSERSSQSGSSNLDGFSHR